jgi:hypothetical protein
MLAQSQQDSHVRCSEGLVRHWFSGFALEARFLNLDIQAEVFMFDDLLRIVL